MGDSIIISVDCHGEWIEVNNRYIWRWKGSLMLETIAMTVPKDVEFDDFVNLIINYCELSCEPKDLVITYMHSSFENQRVLPFKITDQSRLRTYLKDVARPILRVYVVGSPVENHNLAQDQQDVLNDKLEGVDMDIPDNRSVKPHGSGGEPIPIPELTSNTPCAAQSSQSSHVQDDETGFYKGMSFNSRSVYCFRCEHLKCKWWPRDVKILSSSKHGRRWTKRAMRKNKCSLCKTVGHKKTTCPSRNAP
ncbi:uncharacterized protein LOC132612813 [Lycium barbarum]|uniref:uncharacterized protein LOC132612813 n=1 Tax=Lycium barbarum TaxID=112863 RepID=UPI00293E6FFE|nr:uncharacterized protein LOC132612813 [Lycium barbarum]